VWFDPGVGHVLPGEVLEYHRAANVLSVQAVIAGKVRQDGKRRPYNRRRARNYENARSKGGNRLREAGRFLRAMWMSLRCLVFFESGIDRSMSRVARAKDASKLRIDSVAFE